MPLFWRRQPRQQEETQLPKAGRTSLTAQDAPLNAVVTQEFDNAEDDEMATAIHEFDEPSVSSRPPRVPSPPRRPTHHMERSSNRRSYEDVVGGRMEASSVSSGGTSIWRTSNEYLQRPRGGSPPPPRSRSGRLVDADGSSYYSANSHASGGKSSRNLPHRYNRYAENDGAESSVHSTASGSDYTTSTYLDNQGCYSSDLGRHNGHCRTGRSHRNRRHQHEAPSMSGCSSSSGGSSICTSSYYHPQGRCTCEDRSTVVSSSSYGGGSCRSVAGKPTCSSSACCCCCCEGTDKHVTVATHSSPPTVAGPAAEPAKKVVTTTIQTVAYDSAGNPCGSTTTTTTNNGGSSLVDTHAALAAAHRSGGALFPTDIAGAQSSFPRPLGTGSAMPMTVNGVPVVVPVGSQGTALRPSMRGHPELTAGPPGAGYGVHPSRQQQWFY